jgi:anti-sigma-K factor RskA
VAHEQFEESAALSVVDGLEPEERQALASHIGAGCEECRAALREYQATASLLPYALPPEPAPLDLQSHLMRLYELDFAKGGGNAVQEPQPEKGRWGGSWSSLFWPSAVAFASVVLLIILGGYALTLRSQLQTEAAQRRQIETAMHDEAQRLAALQAQASQQEESLKGIRNALADQLGTTRDTLAARETELAQLRDRLAQQEQQAVGKAPKDDGIAMFLRAPNVKVVSLAGSDEAKAAGGLLFYDPSKRRALLYVFNMPPLPADKTYQLWAILDKPISAATFGTDRGNKSRVMISRVPQLDRIKQFAVSVEPDGGSPQPTGPIYLSGQV